MDPNATLRHLLDALREGDRDLVLQALDDLAGWIRQGGWLPNPDYERREEVSLRTALVCREYARLRCAAHQARLELAGDTMVELFVDLATQLYESAPFEALRHLDACKRVVEIDTHVNNPDVVLMRAAVRGV
jgi:hypothetical protein